MARGSRALSAQKGPALQAGFVHAQRDLTGPLLCCLCRVDVGTGVGQVQGGETNMSNCAPCDTVGSQAGA